MDDKQANKQFQQQQPEATATFYLSENKEEQ
jgi:hypothetical protein